MLGSLLILISLSAFGGGTYGILTGAPAVPKQWLAGTPFSSYLIPSLVLFIVVGGVTAVAANLVLGHSDRAKRLSIVAGGIQLGWIAAQVALIGFVSWLQPAVAACGALTILLALFLPQV